MFKFSYWLTQWFLLPRQSSGPTTINYIVRQALALYSIHDIYPRVRVLHIPSQWRIQDFSEVGAPTFQGDANIRFCHIFPKNCMKLKEFGPLVRGSEGRLDPPLRVISKSACSEHPEWWTGFAYLWSWRSLGNDDVIVGNLCACAAGGAAEQDVLHVEQPRPDQRVERCDSSWSKLQLNRNHFWLSFSTESSATKKKTMTLLTWVKKKMVAKGSPRDSPYLISESTAAITFD